MWMRGKGLGTCARQLVGEIAAVKSLDIVLPVKSPEGQTELRMGTGARPRQMAAELLHRLGLQLPEQSRGIQNAVENAVQKNRALKRANQCKSKSRLFELRKMG